jgi:hypothetical protein
MSRSRLLSFGLLLLVIAATLGVAQLFAQPERGFGRPAPAGQIGRYQVVRADSHTIVLLDTVTGDLYAAGPDDLKPYSKRPVGDFRPGFGDRDRPGFDRRPDPERPRDRPPVKDFDKGDRPPVKDKDGE